MSSFVNCKQFNIRLTDYGAEKRRPSLPQSPRTATHVCLPRAPCPRPRPLPCRRLCLPSAALRSRRSSQAADRQRTAHGSSLAPSSFGRRLPSDVYKKIFIFGVCVFFFGVKQSRCLPAAPAALSSTLQCSPPPPTSARAVPAASAAGASASHQPRLLSPRFARLLGTILNFPRVPRQGVPLRSTHQLRSAMLTDGGVAPAAPSGHHPARWLTQVLDVTLFGRWTDGGGTPQAGTSRLASLGC